MESLDRYAAIARQVELFRGIAPDDVHKILHKGMTMRAERGQTIFHKGTTGNTMYIILGGSVALFDGKKQLATLRVGDMFGEMALINNEPRSASALAAEETMLFALDETTFHKLMTKSVAIRMLLNIITTLSHRLRKANERLAEPGS
ncbi:MAG: cyclic nucleotide-binding domain-containing protein [FCB group bacterium]|jgi:CRP-like cAMP-binding protein|nr:cyclic nucleotide-binding domain-containing protein [FCB group bacterium]